MKDVLRRLAGEQEGVVACWQLEAHGLTWNAIKHRTGDLRALHDGVHVTGDAPVTRRQHWWAAVLTAPGRVLSHASAAAAWGFRPWEGSFEVVTSTGSGGPRRFGALLVCRSTRIDQTTLDGLPITTPERTLADLWSRTHEGERRKMLREALRLQSTTPGKLQSHLDSAPARRRPASLAAYVARYERLQLHRCKSDAEARALELVDRAGLALPDVNVRRAGEEADLSWPDRRLIIEIDGGQFHKDKQEDARKAAAWTTAGWCVRRVTSDTVFERPDRLIEMVRRA